MSFLQNLILKMQFALAYFQHGRHSSGPWLIVRYTVRGGVQYRAALWQEQENIHLTKTSSGTISPNGDPRPGVTTECEPAQEAVTCLIRKIKDVVGKRTCVRASYLAKVISNLELYAYDDSDQWRCAICVDGVFEAPDWVETKNDIVKAIDHLIAAGQFSNLGGSCGTP